MSGSVKDRVINAIVGLCVDDEITEDTCMAEQGLGSDEYADVMCALSEEFDIVKMRRWKLVITPAVPALYGTEEVI